MPIMKNIENLVRKIHPFAHSSVTGYVITDTSIYEKQIPVNSSMKFVDTDLYDGFQLYLKDFANPVRIDISEKELINKNICPECYYEFEENHVSFDGELIISEKYKDVEEQKAIRDLVSATPRSDNTLLWILGGSMIMNLIFAILIGVT